jgi:hypothetical protein
MEGSCTYEPPNHRIAGWSTPLPSVPPGTKPSPRKRWQPPQGHPRRPDDLLRPHPPVLDAGDLRLTRATLAVPTTSFAPIRLSLPPATSAWSAFLGKERREPRDAPGSTWSCRRRSPPALAASLHLRSPPVPEPSPTAFREKRGDWVSGGWNRDVTMRADPGLCCSHMDWTGYGLDGRMDGFVGSIWAWVGSGPKKTHPGLIPD